MILGAGEIDEASLREALLARARRLRRYIDVRIPRSLRAWGAPEDLLQEVWIDVFREITSFRGDSEDDFDRWLTTLTNHTIIDFVRFALAEKRGGGSAAVAMLPLPGSSLGDAFGRLASGHSTPSRVGSRAEAVAAIRNALAGLGGDHARAVRMRYIEEIPTSKIARLMNRSEPSIRSLLFRGLRRMRTLLGSSEKYFSDPGR